MISLLQAILCVLQNILLAIAWAGAQLVNGVIIAVAAFAALILGLLPEMPELPDAANATALSWMAWFYPVAPVMAMLGTFAVLLLVYKGLQIALRWMKAEV